MSTPFDDLHDLHALLGRRECNAVESAQACSAAADHAATQVRAVAAAAAVALSHVEQKFDVAGLPRLLEGLSRMADVASARATKAHLASVIACADARSTAERRARQRRRK